MGFLFLLVIWAILFAIAWPIALLLLVLIPFLWILSIPFRIVGFVLEGALALIRQILLLPARILGFR
ncbi:MAG: hypothetical protein EPO35_08010 [Acidobacteria bacterium]|nr:MAG: hypothetical protein EPO35_08010 [Acidobacteriota bacterium]